MELYEFTLRMGNLPKVNTPWVIGPEHLRFVGCRIHWTWPRCLRWAERLYRKWWAGYEVSYSFEVKP